jgi:hypothetical protein
VNLKVVRLVDPAYDTYRTVGTGLGGAAASNYAIADTAMRVPLHQGDTFALDLSYPGEVFINAPNDPGDPADGDGHIAVVDNANTVDSYQAVPRPDGSLDFAVRVEPDADGDGYGDETQDQCPAFNGGYDGCPLGGPSAVPHPPATPATPAPPTPSAGTIGGAVKPSSTAALLTTAHLRGAKLSYTLRTAAIVRARIERRRAGGHWRTIRTVTLSGRAGAHTTKTPKHAHGDRLVLTVRPHKGATGQTATTKTIILP